MDEGKKYEYQLGFYRYPGGILEKPIRKVTATRDHMEMMAIFLAVLFKDSKHVPEGCEIAYDYINPRDAFDQSWRT